MLSPSIERLIWKETRTLAGLWGFLLLMLAFLSGLAPLLDLFLGSHVSQQPDDALLVLAGCLAVAGAAVMFAGEFEESTVGLLQVLPIRGRDLVLAKVGVLTLAVVTFVVAAAGLVLILGLLTTGSLQRVFWLFDGAVHGNSLFGAFAWGVFFALRGRRVLPAIGCAAAAELLTVGLIGNVIADQRPTWREPLYWMVVGAVSAADLYLARGWPWVGSTAPAEASRLALLGSSRDWLARFWLRALARCAAAGSPGRRWLGVLMWRELRRGIAPILGWLALGATAFAAVLFAADGRHYIGGLLAWHAATPLLCGLLLSGGERRGASPAFLSDRGVSPIGVWWLRQGFWAGTALFLIVGMCSVSTLLLDPRELVGARFVIRRPETSPDAAAYMLLNSVLFTSLFGSLFAWGQICGLWFRSALVSSLVAIVLALPLLAWHQLTVFLDVSPLASCWPLMVLWLIGTAVEMPAWLNGDRSRRSLCRRAVWMAAPPLLVMCILCVARRLQIPDVRPGIDVPVAANRIEPMQDMRDDWMTIERSPSYHPADTNGKLPVWAEGKAQSMREAGELEQELNFLLACLRLNRILESQMARPVELARILRTRRSLCKETAAWANDERQTVELLERAIPLLEAEFSHEIAVQPMLQRWEREMLRCIDAGVEPFASAGAVPPPTEGPLARGLLRLLGEPGRQARLVRYMAAAAPNQINDRGAMRDFAAASFLRADGRSFTTVSLPVDEIGRWEASTLGGMARWTSSYLDWMNEVRRDIEETRTAERASLLIVALQAYRLRQGEFPQDVSALLDGPLTRLPVAPRSETLFEFRPEGNLEPTSLDLFHVLPANQPLLFLRSTFDAGRRLLPDSITDGGPLTATYGVPSASHVSLDDTRRLSRSYHELHPTRIALVIPWGSIAVRAWFCPAVHDLKDGRYVDSVVER